MTAHLTAYADARERAVAAWLGAKANLQALRERSNLTAEDDLLIKRLVAATERLDDAYTAAQNRRRADGTWGHAPEEAERQETEYPR